MKTTKATTLQLMLLTSSAAVAGILLLAGCASSSSSVPTSPEAKPVPKAEAKPQPEKRKGRPEPVANPSKVKFGEFKVVELKEIVIAERHRDHKGNQKSASIMNDMLRQQLQYLFSNVKVIPQNGDFSKGGERTLQIEPCIKDMAIISTGTRVWLGAMAGGSRLFMQVTYRDSSTGQVIADPEFYESSDGWTGGWTMGATDNRLRDEIAKKIATYTQMNK
jgi:hypothetical protein